MKYLLLCQDDSRDLQDCVNESIRAGWKPQGGVSVAVYIETYDTIHGKQSDFVYRYAQALVKEE